MDTRRGTHVPDLLKAVPRYLIEGLKTAAYREMFMKCNSVHFSVCSTYTL